MNGEGGSYVRNPDGSLTLVSRTGFKKPEPGLSAEAVETVRTKITGTRRKPKEKTDG